MPVLLQVPFLCHDPEGPAGPHGVDSGHFTGWKDLYLRLQRQRGPITLLWYLAYHSKRKESQRFLADHIVSVYYACALHFFFLRFAQRHGSGRDQNHGQGALQRRRYFQKQLFQKSCLSLCSLLFTSKWKLFTEFQT